MWGSQSTLTLLMGIENGAATLAHSAAAPPIIKCGVTVWPGNSTPKYAPRQVKTYVQTKTWTWMFIEELSIISKKWKKWKISINWWMVEISGKCIHTYNIYCIYNEILFCYKRNEVNEGLMHAIAYAKQKHYAKWKKPVTKDLCYIKLLNAVSRVGKPIQSGNRLAIA